MLQGGTLPALVRRLGLRGPDPRSDALQGATVLESTTRVALAKLDEIARDEHDDETVQSVRDRISARPHAMWEKLGARDRETPAEQYRRLRLVTLQAEREEVLRIRRAGTVEADVVEQVLAMLDIEESMLDLANERSEELSEQPVATPTAAEGPCGHLEAAPADIASQRRDRLRRLRARRHPAGPPAGLPELRQGELLRFLGRTARRAALPPGRARGDAVVRAR